MMTITQGYQHTGLQSARATLLLASLNCVMLNTTIKYNSLYFSAILFLIDCHNFELNVKRS